MLVDAQWMSLEPLIEACRPKGKTPPQDLRRTIDVPQACMLVTIDLWPDDWAASLRTAGRTFRLPLQMLDILPAPVLGCGAYAPCCERTSNGDWNREVVQRTEGLWLHPAR